PDSSVKVLRRANTRVLLPVFLQVAQWQVPISSGRRDSVKVTAPQPQRPARAVAGVDPAAARSAGASCAALAAAVCAVGAVIAAGGASDVLSDAAAGAAIPDAGAAPRAAPATIALRMRRRSSSSS